MRQFIVEAPMMLKVAFFGWSKHWSMKSRIFWLKDIAISFGNIFWPDQPTRISPSIPILQYMHTHTCLSTLPTLSPLLYFVEELLFSFF